MVEVIPAILTSNLDELKDLLGKAETVAKRIQIDIIDGQFANNKSLDPIALSNIDTGVAIDLHLMVKEPVAWIEKCARVEADRIFGHIEMMSDQLAFIERVQGVGILVGLAIDLDTPIEKISIENLSSLDAVLVMSVKAGFGGQEFQEKALEKIKNLDTLRKKNNMRFRICVDGGVIKENIKSIVQAGADEVTVGRRLFEGKIAENIKSYQEAGEIE